MSYTSGPPCLSKQKSLLPQAKASFPPKKTLCAITHGACAYKALVGVLFLVCRKLRRESERVLDKLGDAAAKTGRRRRAPPRPPPPSLLHNSALGRRREERGGKGRMGKVWKESPAALLSYLLPSSAHLLLLGKDYGRKVEITTLPPPPPPPPDQMHEKEFQETFEIPPLPRAEKNPGRLFLSEAETRKTPTFAAGSCGFAERFQLEGSRGSIVD